MPRLTIELAAGADTPGLSIRRDDVEIDRGLLGTSLPVDPGRHVVEASAPGHHSWKTEVNARERSGVRVNIPVLKPTRRRHLSARWTPTMTATCRAEG